MKILFAYRYGNLGGVSAQLLSRLAGFSTQPDVEVHLAFVQDHGLSAELGDAPHVLFEESPRRIAAYCEKNQIDVISVIDTPEVLDAVVSARAGRAVLLEVHTTYAESLGYLANIPAGVDAVIVPSAYSEGLVRRHLGRSLPIETVRNCVDTEEFRPRELEAPADPVCLWVGKLDDHKNWRGFIEIAHHLLREKPSLQFWLVGGRTAPVAAKDELLVELYRSTLSSRVRWLDWVPRSAMPRVFASVAASGGVSLVTSRDESFGMSIAESILCGCPVVSTDVGAISEIVSNPAALRLYDFGDVGAAVELVLASISAPAGRSQGEAWHAELAATVSPREVCASYCELINQHLRS